MSTRSYTSLTPHSARFYCKVAVRALRPFVRPSVRPSMSVYCSNKDCGGCDGVHPFSRPILFTRETRGSRNGRKARCRSSNCMQKVQARNNVLVNSLISFEPSHTKPALNLKADRVMGLDERFFGLDARFFLSCPISTVMNG